MEKNFKPIKYENENKEVNGSDKNKVEMEIEFPKNEEELIIKENV